MPGIGDMVWHLPHIRAVAAYFGEPVTLLAKPRSAADQLFAAEATVRDVLWVDRNPEARRGRHDGAVGLARLVTMLRARGFRRAVLLHHGRTLALACLAAGIPERYGYGFGLQRTVLNRPPYLPAAALQLHPFEQASSWIAAAGMPIAESEPSLPVPDAALRIVRARLGGRVPVVIGIGSSEPYKQWGAERFAILAGALAATGRRSLVLVGGPAERSLADEIAARIGGVAEIMPALGWTLGELAALCAEAVFYVGNDTGAMNLAAAVGTPTFGLFGAVPPIRHASRIVPILPADGRVNKQDGMARIAPNAVLSVIKTATAMPRSCPTPAGSPRP